MIQLFCGQMIGNVKEIFLNVGQMLAHVWEMLANMRKLFVSVGQMFCNIGQMFANVGRIFGYFSEMFGNTFEIIPVPASLATVFDLSSVSADNNQEFSTTRLTANNLPEVS
ncbi:MAG: hypothetical protein IPM21_01550 [Acidobacteria bacterium]|nr:hypothetical protein [Acidobacteriota bacterium]